MEWLEDPKLEFNQEDPNTKICVLSLIGGTIIGCATSGLLCGSLCLVN